MNAEGTEDLQSLRQLAERFAKKELEPRTLDRDGYPYAPLNDEAIQKAKELGLLTLILPEERGGSGLGMRALCRTLESVAEVEAGFAAILFVNNMAHAAIRLWGTAEGTPHPDGLDLIGLPVYDLPSDLPRDLIAEADGEGYILNGTVEYVALAPIARALILPVCVRDTEKVSFFLVDTDAEGVTVGDPVLSLGLRTCPVTDIKLEQVKANGRTMLCDDAGCRFPPFVSGFRPAAAALALGVLIGSYRAARLYAMERRQGGRMIVEHDQVRLMLANMAVMVETGRVLVDRMAEAAEGAESGFLNEAAHILITEQASRATTDGVQVLGGYGYMQDYGQERRMRDAKQIGAIFGAAAAKRLDLIADILKP